MGTEALSVEARRTHRGPVWTMEPPIDTVGDHPDIDGTPFRRRHDVSDDDALVVTVSRLAVDLKLDALVRAIDAVDLLAATRPIRLVMVGGGEAHDQLAARATAVNARHGRTVVTLAGPALDPRSAYAAADVVVGMGSSALRAMAIGRAVVVQGERGFSEVMEPSAQPLFLHQGFWGVGDDAPGGERLAGQIVGLLDDPARRRELGRYGRRVVTERFSLERMTAVVLSIYRDVLSSPMRRHTADIVEAGWRSARLEVEMHDPRRKRQRHEQRHARLEAARRAGA
jgi:glycosyltransferase involved in cell wall biosynthesis